MAAETPVVVTRHDFHQLFTLGEVLGQGSYGTVRACTHQDTGNNYAVKILSKRRSGEQRTDVIARELRLWSMMTEAPHVAGLFGAYEDANNVYIVQELLTGGDLQGLLEAQGVLDESDAAKAIYSVLSALEACHTIGICYGDVKPANFLLTSMYPSVAHLLDSSKPKGELTLKAVDFGCAEYCPDGCSLAQGLSGTPVYMAPEVIVDHCQSISMDIWAAGVMLYQMLTGQFPFWNTDMAGLGKIHPRQILKDIQSGQVLTDIPACSNLSAAVLDLLLKMLQKDPSNDGADAAGELWFALALGLLLS
eukprot:gene10065-10220_t